MPFGAGSGCDCVTLLHRLQQACFPGFGEHNMLRCAAYPVVLYDFPIAAEPDALVSDERFAIPNQIAGQNIHDALVQNPVRA